MSRQDKDKVFVVTGALGSIGTPIATGLAKTGGTVVLVCRDATRGKEARDEIVKATGNDKVEVQECDLGSLASIRTAAAEVAARHPRIDVLVNNAAAFSSSRKTTRDGFELQFGTNHLAAFLLTRLLEGPLAAAGDGRVVMVAMDSKSPLLWDDLMLEKKYDGMTAYGMSKAANLYFARELAERWKGRVAVHAVHPGMTKTTLISEAPLPIRLVFALLADPPEKGALTPLYAALSPDVAGATGNFYVKCKATPYPKGSEDAAARQRLWTMSEALVGLA